jgi:F-box-like
MCLAVSTNSQLRTHNNRCKDSQRNHERLSALFKKYLPLFFFSPLWVMRTRRQRQIEDEAPFALPPEQLARTFSHLDVRSLVCTAAVVCKRWRAVIASDAMAWTTAMSELDPLAIIGPQGVKVLAQRLTRSGGWLQLALRLGNKACYAPDCSTLGLQFDSTRCCRACQQHAQAGSPVLINDFIFERAPWRTVSTGAELQNALEDCPVGACIRVTGHIQFPDDADPVIIRCRLAGPPSASF